MSDSAATDRIRDALWHGATSSSFLDLSEADKAHTLRVIEALLPGMARPGSKVITRYFDSDDNWIDEPEVHGAEYGGLISPRGYYLQVRYQRHAFAAAGLLNEAFGVQLESEFTAIMVIVMLGFVREHTERCASVNIEIARQPTDEQYAMIGRIISACRKTYAPGAKVKVYADMMVFEGDRVRHANDWTEATTADDVRRMVERERYR